MIRVEKLIEWIGAEFYTGVPDSQLKALCDYLMNTYGIAPEHHIIAANEGNCVAIAAGYYLATGELPAVYLQNSGEGNIINPVASLLNENVYGIPMIFIIGWRGEPGAHDEPQHIYQGKITLKLLDDMGIEYCVLEKETSEERLKSFIDEHGNVLENRKQIAFVIKKGALIYDGNVHYENKHELIREEVIKIITEVSKDAPIISTTGKASRELFEIRERGNQNHNHDFLTVGSMGHSSSIALGVAIHRPDKRIWCIDGDGAALMHMGAMAVIGSCCPNNLIHIILNNEAHESVGGLPTVASKTDLCVVAKACGYKRVLRVTEKGNPNTMDDLRGKLKEARDCNELTFIEIKCRVGSRENLGRPTIAPNANLIDFIHYLRK